MIPADFTDTTPSMTVQTKEKWSLKDGIYLQFRVDDYSYDGGTGADQWIALSLTNEQKAEPAGPAYGGGWLTLLRGVGNGSAQSLPHVTDPATEDFGGTFTGVGTVNISAPMDDEGREIYTFEVTWDGSAYEMKVNGVVQPGSAQTTTLLEKLDANGEFYVGINMQAGVKHGTAACTILKFGTSEATATTPVGSDSKEPEKNEMSIADIADPSTVETNMPAILWTPETSILKTGNNVTFQVLGDNTWRGTATETAVFFQFSPKRAWSYDGADFPVFGILFRNIWVDGGTCWYAAGEVMNSQNDCTQAFSVSDGYFYGEDEEYVFVPMDMTGLWEGRINSIRLDMNMADEDSREFDVCFAGMFRSEEEGVAYAESYLKDKGVTVPDGGESSEEVTTEAATVEENTGAEEVTTAPDEKTTGATTGEGTKAPESETTPKEDGGCASVVGFGAIAILTAAAAAVALKKKD